MKKLFPAFTISLILFAACSGVSDERPDYPLTVAHRGCWFEGLVPENSLEGIRMAARFGYAAIECDVKCTLDGVMVLMHDKTINRTMRNASDYSEIKEPVMVSETGFEDLRTKYVLSSDDPHLRVPIPTLEELLEECLKCGVTPMLHSKVTESYSLSQQLMGDNWICFNSAYDSLRKAREFSGCLVLWDPGKSDISEVLSGLDSIGQPCGVSSMKADLFDKEYVSEILKSGYEVQSSIWKTPLEMRAIHDGATIILSDWCWFPSDDRVPDFSWSPSCRTLHEGEQIGRTFRSSEFSGIALDMSFCGSLRITLNGERTYELAHSQTDEEHIGLRMHDTEPSILIEALSDVTIESCSVNYYKI